MKKSKNAFNDLDWITAQSTILFPMNRNDFCSQKEKLEFEINVQSVSLAGRQQRAEVAVRISIRKTNTVAIPVPTLALHLRIFQFAFIVSGYKIAIIWKLSAT